jgi:hypothetical protein
MKIVSKGKPLFFVGVIFVGILCLIVVALVRIGGAYRSGLNRFSTEEQISDVTHTERQKIRKITIKNTTGSGCMEVTPDGVIRFYNVCQKELSDARRVTDTKFILRLYKKMAETDLTTLPDATNSVCSGYIMTLETDAETKTVCVQNKTEGDNISGGGGGANNGDIGEIITIIDQVIDNIPPTPTMTPDPGNPTIVPGTSISPTPTDMVLPSWGVTPTPTVATARPFICDFTDVQGKKRPYTISNIICSTGPSPGPTSTP